MIDIEPAKTQPIPDNVSDEASCRISLAAFLNDPMLMAVKIIITAILIAYFHTINALDIKTPFLGKI